METYRPSAEEAERLRRVYRVRIDAGGRMILPLQAGRRALLTVPIVLNLLLVTLPLLATSLARHPRPFCFVGPVFLAIYGIGLFLLLRISRKLVLAPGSRTASLLQLGHEHLLSSVRLDASLSAMAGRPCLRLDGGRFFATRRLWAGRAAHEATLPLLCRLVESYSTTGDESPSSILVAFSGPIKTSTPHLDGAVVAGVRVARGTGPFFALFEVLSCSDRDVLFRAPAHEKYWSWPILVCFAVSLGVGLAGFLGVENYAPRIEEVIAHLLALCVLPLMYGLFFRVIQPRVLIARGTAVVVTAFGRVHRADASQSQFERHYSSATEAASELELVLKCGERRFLLWVGTKYEDSELRMIAEQMSDFVRVPGAPAPRPAPL